MTSAHRPIGPAALALVAITAASALTVWSTPADPAHAQRATMTPAPFQSPPPTTLPPASPTPAPPAAPPDGAGVRERGARQVFVPLLGDPVGTDLCGGVVAVFNAGDVEMKPALMTWDRTPAGPSGVECGGLLRPGATWRFMMPPQVLEPRSGVVFSFNMRRLSEVAPGLGQDDLVGDYLCEQLFFGVLGDPVDLRLLRQALMDGGEFKGVPLAQAMGGPLAVAVERSCDVAGQEFMVAAEYAGTPFDDSLSAWTPSLERYRYALPALHGPDAAGAGPRSRIVIQNAGADYAAVELLLAGDGAECEPPRRVFSRDIAPGASVVPTELLPSGASAGWVLGTQPLAVVVETADAETLTAYEAAPAPVEEPPPAAAVEPGPSLHAPLVYADIGGWSTTVQLQNLSQDTAAMVKLYAHERGGDIEAAETVWICPSGHVDVDVGSALGLTPDHRYTLRIASLPWQTADPAPAPAGVAAVVEITRRLPGAAHDSEAGAYRVTGGQRGRFADGPTVLVVPDVAAPSTDVRTIGDLAILNTVTLPGLTSVVVAFGEQAGLFHNLECRSMLEKSVAYVTLDTAPTDVPPFRGAALVSAASWDHLMFDERGVLRANVVGLALAAIERPVGSMPWDERPDDDAPGDATRIQGGIPIHLATAGGPLVRRSVDGQPLRDVCPAGPNVPTATPSAGGTPPVGRPTEGTAMWRISLPFLLRNVEKPLPLPPSACDAPWNVRLSAVADGGADEGDMVTPCNGRAEPADALGVAGCPLPTFSVGIVSAADSTLLWRGDLPVSPNGAGATIHVVVCAPPPYFVSIFRSGDGAACWRACPGSPEVRAVNQADFDAAEPAAGPGKGRNVTVGWGYDRVATVAVLQGPPIAYLPILNFIGDDDVCAAQVRAQNTGAEISKAVLVTWGEPGFCPPAAAGPLKVECSGLIRPGGSWNFIGPQIPTGSRSGYVVSLTAKLLSEIGVEIGVDDVTADFVCETLFFNIVGDGDDERRFHRAFLNGETFEGVPMNRAYGGPVAVHVERACPSALPMDTDTEVVTDSYVALSHRQVDTRPGDVAEYRYPLPALVADAQSRTLVYLQNAGLTCADVQLTYRAAGGGIARCANLPLAPGETHTVDIAACLAAEAPGDGLASPGVGWAVGTAPLAVVVDVVGRGAGTLASYAAPPATDQVDRPDFPLAAPLLLPSPPSAPQRARMFIQNLDPDRLAFVVLIARDRRGDIATRIDGITITPGAGTAIDVAVPLFGGTVHVTSTCAPLADCPTVAPIAAALLQWRQADAESPPRDAVIGLLAPRGSPAGTIRGTAVGVTRLAIPTVGKAIPANTLAHGDQTSRIALVNRVDKPGFTDVVLYVYDQNGLLDYICHKLNERETEYIDLTTWGFVNNGFRGSLLVSAFFWEHDVFDGEGNFVRNLVDLDAAFGWSGAAGNDDATLNNAVPLSPDFPWPVVFPHGCAEFPVQGTLAHDPACVPAPARLPVPTSRRIPAASFARPVAIR